MSQPPNDPRRTSKQGRGRRRAGVGLLVFGVVVLIAAFVPSTASAQATSFLPSGTSTTTYSCTGNDADDGGTTNAVLTGIGLNPVSIDAEITSDAVDAPNDGDTFTMTFHWRFTLPSALTSIAVWSARRISEQQRPRCRCMGQRRHRRGRRRQSPNQTSISVTVP